MVLVRRPLGRLDANQPDNVRRRVGERVEAVGQDADGAAGVAEGNLGDGDAQVEEEDSQQDA
jgi:hypothetical protein